MVLALTIKIMSRVFSMFFLDQIRENGLSSHYLVMFLVGHVVVFSSLGDPVQALE